MKLSTSSRISLGFSLLSIIILGLFSLVVYQLFNQGRQRSEKNIVRTDPRIQQLLQEREQQGKKIMRVGSGDQTIVPKIFQQTQLLESTDTLFLHIKQLRDVNGYTTYGDAHYFYAKKMNKIVVKDVTQHINKQHELLEFLLFGMLGGALISFFLGRIFVSWALRDVRILTKKIAQVDIHTLNFGHEFDHLPAQDEIRILATTLSTMTTTLKGQVDDMKSFVANAAHELRTPLMIIRSSAELAHKTKAYEIQLPKITQTIGQMEGLISTLLLLARTQTNGFEKQEVIPIEILLPVVEQMKQKWAAKNIHFSLSTAPSKALEAYKGSLERVFHNLIDNAYKYTPNGGTISCVVNARGCIISDTGVGIASKDIQHVRKPFWQVDQSRGQDEGFGIGLALVKRLVDLHGRKVEIESELGKGTKVHLMW